MWIAGLVEVLIMLQRSQHRQTGTCTRLVSLAIAGSVDATATLDFRATNDRQSALSMVDRQPLSRCRFSVGNHARGCSHGSVCRKSLQLSPCQWNRDLLRPLLDRNGALVVDHKPTGLGEDRVAEIVLRADRAGPPQPGRPPVLRPGP
jgi:hypothetical protein